MMETGGKIFPRNLTAHATYKVAGNPATSRPEDAVANCFPGLEMDVRNLDRRFFPGLVFDFVEDEGQPLDVCGAFLRFVDFLDPDLTQPTTLARKLHDTLANMQESLGDGPWYLNWIEQEGKRISLNGANGQPLEGSAVWRIVRSLEPARRWQPGDPAERLEAGEDSQPTLKISLRRRPPADQHGPSQEPLEIELEGWRRAFTDPKTGVLSLAYQPGEMLQSLCSPWQHDFRDCQCHYWAANRPDVVYREVLPGEPVLPDGASADPEPAETPLDWMRSDRDPDLTAAAKGTIEENRPFQLDHYQINRDWQRLNVVVGDHEIGSTYTPLTEIQAAPFASAAELVDALRLQMAPRELTLALEYLYARFSIISEDDAKAQAAEVATLRDDVVFVRHYLLLIATGEMQHLRWANQLLWELRDAGFVEIPFTPVLEPAEWIPGLDWKRGLKFEPERLLTGPTARQPSPAEVHDAKLPRLPASWRWRRRLLRPLTMEALEDFIADEHPGGDIDTTYGRVVATLRQSGYPRHLAELAERILKDGNDHFNHFRAIRTVLQTTYKAGTPYLRELKLVENNEAVHAMRLYRDIVDQLGSAYSEQSMGDVQRSSTVIRRARQKMDALLKAGEALAANHIGIPFWRDDDASR